MAANFFRALATHLRRLRSWLWLPVVFVPGIFLFTIVAKYAVDIGCWDVWENAPLLDKWRSGTLRWSDLYAAQIQHRIVVPRLIIIALSTLSGGDFRWEIWFTFAVLTLSALLVWRLLVATLGNSSWVAAFALLANLLLFSPMLYQTVFWGSSMWMALPMPCLLLGMAALHRGWPWWTRVGAAILCAEIGTHSFAHGLCLWPVLAVYTAVQPAVGPLKRRLIGAGVIAAAGAVTAAFYFHDFVNVAYHAYNLKPGDSALSGTVAASPATVARVFLAFLGALYARSPWESIPPIERAPAIGAGVLIVFILCAACVLFGRVRRELWPRALPWLAIGAYVTGVGLMIGLGRSQIGEFRAVTPRYLLVSQYFWIATGALVFLLGRNLVSRREAWIEPARRIAVGALVAAAMAQIPNWMYGLHMTRVWHRARLQARALVLFIDHLPWQQGSATRNVVDKSQAYARDAIHTLQRLGLFKPRVLESPEIRWFRRDSASLSTEKAAIEGASAPEPGWIELTGHARFGVERPADLVVFSISDGETGGRIVGLGQPVATPALRLHALDFEFANVDTLPIGYFYRWRGRIDTERLSLGETRLNAWALDVESMTLSRIVDVVQIIRPSDPAAAPAVNIISSQPEPPRKTE